jgi:hypothetical protein
VSRSASVTLLILGQGICAIASDCCDAPSPQRRRPATSNMQSIPATVWLRFCSPPEIPLDELVEAEIARIENRELDAESLYEKAIGICSKCGEIESQTGLAANLSSGGRPYSVAAAFAARFPTTKN